MSINIQDLPNDILRCHIIFSHFDIYKVCFLLNKRFNKLCNEMGLDVSYFLQKIDEHGKLYYVHKDSGLMEGIYREYDNNGNIIKVIDKYRNGLSAGKVYTYYPNGHIKTESEIHKGVLYGKSIEWYDNGIKKEEKTYKAGMQSGKVTEWHPNGSIMYQYDGDGGLVTIKHYYNNGAPKCIYVYKDDVLYSKKMWDINGNVIRESMCCIL